MQPIKIAASAFALTLTAALGAAPVQDARAQDRESFQVCWSIYAGWMPWGWIESSGLMDKWADKYDISVDVVQINDYIESINQYTAGRFDGCTMTNMDALSIPAGGGVDTTALIVGDFSNGNDGIVLKNKDELSAIEGMDVHLVELSVSHYLLARALDQIGLSERDVNVVNVSDADLVAAFDTEDVQATVTWNPLLSTILKKPEANEVFDSSQIPGEIIDLMVVNTETLRANPELGKALVGAWYEAMSIMSSDTQAGRDARTWMAEAAGTDLRGYESQLETTQMFYDPAEAVEFTRDDKLIQTMDFVRQFLFKHGILGQGAPSPDYVGMQFPGGETLGNTNNIQLRFDPSYMKMAAEGEL
ncbi:lipid kinase [Rhodovibrio sodomensis]|uniref:Lipid kinase n=1 Tax=Rhodovibrio sodomensis TaxID=1088 RepID=A0ABS1DCS8_9PROT|nr:putative urea ABC transporter substrate-binding protein [Rhodovibrio sodomensis]MBK1667205.1 lipid kinase [Rhodovibrio sodomensis]